MIQLIRVHNNQITGRIPYKGDKEKIKFQKNLRRQMRTTSLVISVFCLLQNTTNAKTTPGGVTRTMCDQSTKSCISCTSHIIEDEKDCLKYVKGSNGRRGVVKICDKTRVTICAEKVVQQQSPIAINPVLPDCSRTCGGPDCKPCLSSTSMAGQETVSAANGKPTGDIIMVDMKREA